MGNRGWGRDGEWATGGGVGMVNGQQGLMGNGQRQQPSHQPRNVVHAQNGVGRP
jgi:hypothetical protein